MTGKLLVVDDDAASCRLIEATFAAEGLEVVSAGTGPEGLVRAAEDRPDVILLDLRLPGLDGLDVLATLKTTSPAPPIVMLTASRDVKSAVRAIHLGAFDYLTKPVDPEELVAVVRRALETRSLRLDVEDLRRRVGKDEGANLADLMGTSPQVRDVVDQVATVAASDFTVLILGETGTGKELVAQAIHRQSARARMPFVALDCGTIPEALLESELFGYERGAFTGAERRKVGRFQTAEGGTCFLDEVGNLPFNLQAKLLRVLESGQLQPVGATRSSDMNLRFVAATNHDLLSRIGGVQFRSDLYFRLAQFTIVLPPLRDRPEDIPVLTSRFVAEVRVELRRPVLAVLPAAMELLQQYQWPGNVRELRNVIRQAVLQATDLVIRPEAIQAVMRGISSTPAAAGATFPPAVPVPVSVSVPVPMADRSLKELAAGAAQAAERNAIAEVLQTTGGNKSQAAKVLQTDYKTLHLKMKQLGISARDFMPE